MIKILIVEDDNSTRHMLKKLVNDIGYVDILAGNGEMAWDIISVNKDIDLIITDVVLGGMTGFDLLRKIRTEAKKIRIPVIVCSGKITKDEILDFLELGIDLFIEKPIEGKKLQSFILKILEPKYLETKYIM